MLADRFAHILVHCFHRTGRKIGLCVEQRERALFLGQIDRRQIGGAGDRVHPLIRLTRRFFRAIAQTDHQQRIGQTGDAQTDPALGLRLLALRFQWELRRIDDVVHHPHSGGDQFAQRRNIQRRRIAKRIADQPRHVDRAKQASTVGGQRLLAAGVGRGNRLAIAQVVGLVDPVDENHARLCDLIGRLHDRIPQIASLDGAVHGALEHQIPVAARLNRIHKRIGDQHRHVKHPQTGRVMLGSDEILNVGVIAAHRRHHRPAARACGHDRAAHRVPNIHERQRARGIRRHTMHNRALGADRAKVIPDPAALLHR